MTKDRTSHAKRPKLNSSSAESGRSQVRGSFDVEFKEGDERPINSTVSKPPDVPNRGMPNFTIEVAMFGGQSQIVYSGESEEDWLTPNASRLKRKAEQDVLLEDAELETIEETDMDVHEHTVETKLSTGQGQYQFQPQVSATNEDQARTEGVAHELQPELEVSRTNAREAARTEKEASGTNEEVEKTEEIKDAAASEPNEEDEKTEEMKEVVNEEEASTAERAHELNDKVNVQEVWRLPTYGCNSSDIQHLPGIETLMALLPVSHQEFMNMIPKVLKESRDAEPEMEGQSRDTQPEASALNENVETPHEKSEALIDGDSAIEVPDNVIAIMEIACLPRQRLDIQDVVVGLPEGDLLNQPEAETELAIQSFEQLDAGLETEGEECRPRLEDNESDDIPEETVLERLQASDGLEIQTEIIDASQGEREIPERLEGQLEVFRGDPHLTENFSSLCVLFSDIFKSQDQRERVSMSSGEFQREMSSLRSMKDEVQGLKDELRQEVSLQQNLSSWFQRDFCYVKWDQKMSATLQSLEQMRGEHQSHQEINERLDELESQREWSLTSKAEQMEALEKIQTETSSLKVELQKQRMHTERLGAEIRRASISRTGLKDQLEVMNALIRREFSSSNSRIQQLEDSIGTIWNNFNSHNAQLQSQQGSFRQEFSSFKTEIQKEVSENLKGELESHFLEMFKRAKRKLKRQVSELRSTTEVERGKLEREAALERETLRAKMEISVREVFGKPDQFSCWNDCEHQEEYRLSCAQALAHAEAQLQCLKNELDKKEETIVEKEQTILAKNKEVESLHLSIAAKNQEVESVDLSKKKLHASYTTLLEKYADVQKQLSESIESRGQGASYVDGGPTPAILELSCKVTYNSITTFARHLSMYLQSHAMSPLQKLFSEEFSGVHFARPAHRLFATKSYICKHMFGVLDFETSSCGEGDARHNAQVCAKSFEKFEEVNDSSFRQLRNHQDYSDFREYCDAAYSALFNMKRTTTRWNSSVKDLTDAFEVLAGQSPNQSKKGSRSSSETKINMCKAFLLAARKVWALQKLCRSFEPHVRTLRVGRGHDLQREFMESVEDLQTPEDAGTSCLVSQDQKVAFEVFPGFFFRNTIIKCRVY